MTQRERQCATLLAAGFTNQETADQLGISTRTVERAKALPDVQLLIEAKEAAGLSPRDVLNALMYSKNDQTRMKAAVEIGRLPTDPDEPELPPKLQPGVKRVTISYKHVTVEDDAGKIKEAIYPLVQEALAALDPVSDDPDPDCQCQECGRARGMADDLKAASARAAKP